MKKINNTSKDIQKENIDILSSLFPSCFNEGRLDIEKLKNIFASEGVESVEKGVEKYSLSWSGKREAFQNLRTPSTGTLVRDNNGVNEDNTGNIFIEGDNLEVLKLLQKQYFNKIKMIYIDPPYNTGKDFVYKDNFTDDVASYYEMTGQTRDGIKMTANTEKNGRYHSDWLTMMYPRLFLARNLLRDDGVIFVSIDDNEVANLRLIMDEIFGEENVESFVWKKVGDGDAGAGKMKLTYRFRTEHEYIFACYKNKDKTFFKKTLDIPNFKNTYTNPDNDPRGPFKAGNISQSETLQEVIKNSKNCYNVVSPTGKSFIRKWHFSEEEFNRLNKDNRIYWGKNGDAVPSIKIFTQELREVTPTSILENFGSATSANKELKYLFNLEEVIFDNSKPVDLIKYFLKISTTENDIILDFFAGSGTTAHAVMDLNAEDGGNRKYICVQLPEATDENSEAYKAEYKTISQITRERIKRAGEKIYETKWMDYLKKSVSITINKSFDSILKKEEKDYTKEEKELKEKYEREIKTDFGFISYTLQKSNYRIWNTLHNSQDQKEGEEIVQKAIDQAKLWTEKPLVDEYKEIDVVYEILLKEGYDLCSPVKKEKDIYIVIEKITDTERRIFITFKNEISLQYVEDLKKEYNISQNDLFVCFDNSLDDSTKVNVDREVNIRVM